MSYLVPVLFYLFAAGLLFAAVKVVTAKNPVKAALWLVLGFTFAAAQWILMQAVFLGILLLLVYVGAVMVLFLFVIMLLNIDIETMRAGFWKNLPLSFLVGIAVSLLLILILVNPQSGIASINQFKDLPADYNSVKAIGHLLYSHAYVVAFELAAVLLLLGMVAAIALVQRRKVISKRIAPKDQVKVDPRVGRIQVLENFPESELSKEVEEDNTQSKDKSDPKLVLPEHKARNP
ncbi:MAG: NADH-quinone oxidoreductase subunit J [Neisseriaceae bacterium]